MTRSMLLRPRRLSPAVDLSCERPCTAFPGHAICSLCREHFRWRAAQALPCGSSVRWLAAERTRTGVRMLRAEGFQIYECKPVKGRADEFEWVLKAPDAILFDERGEKAGTHFGGPTWQATDGSKIVAVKKADAKAPAGRTIPWLLLEVRSREGTGVLSQVTYIQRTDTWAGSAPASPTRRTTARRSASSIKRPIASIGPYEPRPPRASDRSLTGPCCTRPSRTKCASPGGTMRRRGGDRTLSGEHPARRLRPTGGSPALAVPLASDAT